MSKPPRRRRARGVATVQRLLDAAIHILGSEGASRLSVQRVAETAGTSKGLVHYHFPDKSALLAACAERLTAVLVQLDSDAVSGAVSADVLDRLWAAVESSAADGSRRALIALAAESGTTEGHGIAACDVRRQQAAEVLMGQLQALLQYAPVVSRATLAAAHIALTDGLALRGDALSRADRRLVFDAFWLGVLSHGPQ